MVILVMFPLHCHWYLLVWLKIFKAQLLVLWSLMSCGNRHFLGWRSHWWFFVRSKPSSATSALGWSNLRVWWVVLPTFSTDKLPIWRYTPLMLVQHRTFWKIRPQFAAFQKQGKYMLFQEPSFFQGRASCSTSGGWLLVGLFGSQPKYWGDFSKVWSSAKDKFKEWQVGRQVGRWQETDILFGGDRFEHVFQVHSLEFSSKSVSHVNASWSFMHAGRWAYWGSWPNMVQPLEILSFTATGLQRDGAVYIFRCWRWYLVAKPAVAGDSKRVARWGTSCYINRIPIRRSRFWSKRNLQFRTVIYMWKGLNYHHFPTKKCYDIPQYISGV